MESANVFTFTGILQAKHSFRGARRGSLHTVEGVAIITVLVDGDDSIATSRHARVSRAWLARAREAALDAARAVASITTDGVAVIAAARKQLAARPDGVTTPGVHHGARARRVVVVPSDFDRASA